MGLKRYRMEVKIGVKKVCLAVFWLFVIMSAGIVTKWI